MESPSSNPQELGLEQRRPSVTFFSSKPKRKPTDMLAPNIKACGASFDRSEVQACFGAAMMPWETGKFCCTRAKVLRGWGHSASFFRHSP